MRPPIKAFMLDFVLYLWPIWVCTPSFPCLLFPLSLPLPALPDSHLLLDPGTLNALSIFRQETHPSLMGIGTCKEGFSVFGLLNRCVTHMVCICFLGVAAGLGWLHYVEECLHLLFRVKDAPLIF